MQYIVYTRCSVGVICVLFLLSVQRQTIMWHCDKRRCHLLYNNSSTDFRKVLHVISIFRKIFLCFWFFFSVFLYRENVQTLCVFPHPPKFILTLPSKEKEYSQIHIVVYTSYCFFVCFFFGFESLNRKCKKCTVNICLPRTDLANTRRHVWLFFSKFEKCWDNSWGQTFLNWC